MNASELDQIRFDSEGLVPVVAQDRATGRVLMVAWANREALQRTLETGDAHFWSRSRGELWRKGATSGNVLRNADLSLDCDGDTLLMRVDATGPACHTGATTCFDRNEGERVESGESPPAGTELQRLWATLQLRAQTRPKDSYTVRLLDDTNLRVKKLGEETTELVVALTNEDRPAIAEEAADLIYHVMTALLGAGVEWSEVEAVLADRRT